jgi:hypothetical protein
MMLAQPSVLAPRAARWRSASRCTRHARAAVAARCGAVVQPWRLADAGLAPPFAALAVGIEQLWLSHAGTAPLSPLLVDPRFLVVEGGVAEERIRIENRFYASPRFRKCHLELAAGVGGLSVLHCVMYPWAAHDLPLFAVDMVAFGVRRARARARVRNSLLHPDAPCARGSRA